MDNIRNAFKHALKAGKSQIGLWSTLCSPLVIEAVADSGFDWLLLDMEHSPNELDTIIAQLQASMRGTATPIVRPPWNDAVVFKRLLDSGAQSLLVPYVQSAAEAAHAVAATRYPPAGIRGVAGMSRASRFGRIGNYLKTAHEEICLLVQVETGLALQQLEAIATVDGVDGVFIGPSDLAASLGHIGNPQHPDVQKALEDAARRLKAVHKPAGILTANETEARRYMESGYAFVAVGIDTTILVRGADALAKTFKG
jgi:4-hydroxy-2-oxoheptanedioate aldolase